MKYTINMPNGKPVTVEYYPRYSLIRELDHRVDHFEFRGEISSTGYRSQFVMVDPDLKETKEMVIEQAKRWIEEWTGQKYGGVNQLALI